jgi:cytosine/adenosine deaminase-related metal-dependent hydrolase
MLLRARIVLPISRDPVEDGAVLIANGMVQKVGTWKELASTTSDVVDLGEAILLPGLINSHCHLDYTDMAGQISAPKHFSDWIKGILALKASWSYSEYAKSWVHGAQMLLRTGTTTVADIEAVPELIPEVWHATPLRLFSFFEMTGVKSNRRPSAILKEVLDNISELSSAKNFAGLSPHSLYSTTPELIRLCANAAVQKNLRLTTHVAESKEEFAMFTERSGAMYDWLKTQRDTADCSGNSPVQQLDAHGILSSRLLAVHVNYLADGDADLLSQRGTSVVHCPRSHGYFRHHKFPENQLKQAGVNICLGTDSLASVKVQPGQDCELNMFTEMQAFATHSKARPETILRMATVNGAKALGLETKAGEITENAYADLISIPFAGQVSEVNDYAVHFCGAVQASMIAGQWAFPPTA